MLPAFSCRNSTAGRRRRAAALGSVRGYRYHACSLVPSAAVSHTSCRHHRVHVSPSRLLTVQAACPGTWGPAGSQVLYATVSP